MSKARMRRALKAFGSSPLIRDAAKLSDAGDGSIHDVIVAALFVASNEAEKRHQELLKAALDLLGAAWKTQAQFRTAIEAAERAMRRRHA